MSVYLFLNRHALYEGSFFFFLIHKLSCVRLGSEKWPAAVAAVLYKIKVCFGVSNESLRLSQDTDNHCRIYCPLFTLLKNTQTYIDTQTNTHLIVLSINAETNIDYTVKQSWICLPESDENNLAQGHTILTLIQSDKILLHQRVCVCVSPGKHIHYQKLKYMVKTFENMHHR